MSTTNFLHLNDRLHEHFFYVYIKVSLLLFMRSLESLRVISLGIPSVIDSSPSIPPRTLLNKGVLFHLAGQVLPGEDYKGKFTTPLTPTYSYYVRGANFDPENPMSDRFIHLREPQLAKMVVTEKAAPLTPNSPLNLIA